MANSKRLDKSDILLYALVSGVLLSCCPWSGYARSSGGSTLLLGGYAFLAALAIFVAVVWRDRRHKRKSFELKRIYEKELESLLCEAIDSEARSLQPIFSEWSGEFRLQKKEQGLWAGPVKLGRVRTRTTRYNYAGPAARIKIAKGLHFKLGSIAVRPVREDFFSVESEGTLVITNKRISYMSNDPSKSNWTKTWRSIACWRPYDDAIQVDLNNGKPVFFIPRPTESEPSQCWCDARVINVVMDIAQSDS